MTDEQRRQRVEGAARTDANTGPRTLARLSLVALAAAAMACGDSTDGGQIADARSAAADARAGTDARPVDAGPADAHEYTGICRDETRNDHYASGMVRTGDSGYQLVLEAASPAPPTKGDNTWTLTVLDPADRAVGGLVLDAVPFMPDHGHGTPVRAVSSPREPSGTYDVAPVNLWMSGLWSIRVALLDPAADSAELDRIVYRFCVEEP